MLKIQILFLVAFLFGLPSVQAQTCPNIIRFEEMNKLSLADFLKEARFKLQVDQATDKILGFKLLEMKSCGVYESMGFKLGDILVEVNGERYNSLTAVMDFYNALKEPAPLQVKVTRDGKQQSLTIQ